MVDTIPSGLTATKSTAIFSVVKSRPSLSDDANEDETGDKMTAIAHISNIIRLVEEHMSDSFQKRP